MPVGTDASELFATAAQQREYVSGARVPQNQAPVHYGLLERSEYVGGCSRRPQLLHINANGDGIPVLSCITLIPTSAPIPVFEAYCKPLFMGYKDNQPFNKNMLRPCPVLDNPGDSPR